MNSFVSREEAIIIWDAPSQTQHFIRRATINTTARQVGFLVPTPSEPELAEVPTSVFDELLHYAKPKATITPTAPLLMSCTLSASRDTRRVEVLQRTQVAGYEAVVLRASRSDSLAGWMKDNGFPEGKGLAEWLSPYVEKGWFVTAFKVTEATGTGALATALVRMSVKTESPYFPYREPERDGRPSAPLRLFLIANSAMAGEFRGDDGAVPWNSFLLFRDHLKLDAVPTLTDALPTGLQGDWHLTAYTTKFWADRSPESDLFFVPEDGPAYRSKREIPIPVDLSLIVLALAFGLRRFWKQRMAEDNASSASN
jgi:hypothetical protein